MLPRTVTTEAKIFLFVNYTVEIADRQLVLVRLFSKTVLF